jgi:hypothetical protein
MKFTIVPENNFVCIDELGYELDTPLENLDGIHAVQWYGAYGEIEYSRELVDGAFVKPENEIFSDTSRFQPAIDLWTIRDDAEKEAMAALMEEMRKSGAGPTPPTGEIPVVNAGA